MSRGSVVMSLSESPLLVLIASFIRRNGHWVVVHVLCKDVPIVLSCCRHCRCRYVVGRVLVFDSLYSIVVVVKHQSTMVAVVVGRGGGVGGGVGDGSGCGGCDGHCCCCHRRRHVQ